MKKAIIKAFFEGFGISGARVKTSSVHDVIHIVEVLQTLEFVLGIGICILKFFTNLQKHRDQPPALFGFDSTQGWKIVPFCFHIAEG